jgi:hypothetical protein
MRPIANGLENLYELPCLIYLGECKFRLPCDLKLKGLTLSS